MSNQPAQDYGELVEVAKARNHALKQQAGNQHVKRPRTFAAELLSGTPLPPPAHEASWNYFITIDHPSPPCVKSIDELEAVTLSELVMGSHHRGKFLLVAFLGDGGSGRTNAFACVADTNMDFECLKLPFICMNSDVGHRWPQQGRWFAIKEPHLTIEETSMDACIRIDHPSDLLDVACLPKSQLTRAVFSSVRAELSDTTSLQYKEAGNLALKKGNLSESLACYTRGLQGCLDDSGHNLLLALVGIGRDLLRNRAFIRLKLGQYEGAVVDAIASLSDQTTDDLKKLDAKAYFRAGEASYALKRYDAAAEYCKNLLILQENDKDATELLARSQARSCEQSSGVYNIAAIRKGVSRAKPRVDVADFLSNTTVKTSGPNRGRGLFATKDLKADDLILTETAFASVWHNEKTYVVAVKHNSRFHNENAMKVGPIGLWKVALQKAGNNRESGGHLLDLYGDHNVLGNEIAENDGVSVVDAYQVHDIVARNAFGLGDPHRKQDYSSGIYIRSSYINHSCVPNSRRDTIGDLLLLHATRPIAMGEEISICYLGDELESYASRKESTKYMWNFQCECALCLVEAQVPEAVLAKRDGLAHEAAAFMSRTSSRRGTTERQVLQAEKFAREIAATYDGNLYSNLPRTALVDIQAWIANTTTACPNLERSKQTLPNILRSLGFEVEEHDGIIETISPTPNSIMTGIAHVIWSPLVAHALQYRRAGRTQAATCLTEFARALDRILNGTDAETDRVFDAYSKLPSHHPARTGVEANAS
jgi:tetratricopeptide (TPR) repeat protein